MAWHSLLHGQMNLNILSNIFALFLTRNIKTIYFDNKLNEICLSHAAENERTSLSKLIFQIRSQTMDIKTWQPWKYSEKPAFNVKTLKKQ